MTASTDIDIKKIWLLLAQVNDPEIPVLSVIDLGIIRDVKKYNISSLEGIEVIITPTYSGCPAMNTIAWDIKTILLENGYANFKLTTVLSPAWTTDWMSELGKNKLKAYGIAAPNALASACDTTLFPVEIEVQCPQCNSLHTQLLSQFGSTACKALYQCIDCKEPFDYFKCH